MRLDETFDLIVMTGHAFQCLLTQDDQQALCATIAAHLAPGGTFIFDSRNPAVEEWRQWTPDQSRGMINVPGLGQFETWHDVRFDHDTGIAAYDTVYCDQKTGQTWQATSRILFASQSQIAAAIESAGLKAHRWMGDWTGRPMTETSPEIIPVGGLAGGSGTAAPARPANTNAPAASSPTWTFQLPFDRRQAARPFSAIVRIISS